MKARQIAGWIFALLLAGLGLTIYFLMYSHRFIGYVFLGAAGVLSVFLLLHLLECRLKRTAKVIRLIFSVLIGLSILAAATTGVQIALESGGRGEEACDYLIVLGCAVNGDRPSQMLQYRIDAAYAYLKKNPNTRCIVTGGIGTDDKISEAQCMFNELTRMGIAAERIWMEERSTNTEENIRFAKALLKEKTGDVPENIGVLTGEFHLYRAKEVAEDQSMTVKTVSAKTERKGLLVNYTIREVLAVWKYKFL